MFYDIFFKLSRIQFEWKFQQSFADKSLTFHELKIIDFNYIVLRWLVKNNTTCY